MSLRSRLLATLMPAALLSMGVLAFLTFRAARASILSHVLSQAQTLGQARADELDLHFKAARAMAEGLASSIAAEPELNASEILDGLLGGVRENPTLLGMAVALDPHATPLGAFAPFVYREGREIQIQSLATEDYRYPEWEWYRVPMEKGHGLWGVPYVGGAVKVLTVTYSAPIWRGGRIVGLVTADLTLEHLSNLLDNMKPESGATAYLASRDGAIIASPKSVPAFQPGADSLRRLGEMIRKPGRDFCEMVDPISGKQSWVIEQPMASIGGGVSNPKWALVFSYPTDALLEPLRKLRREMLLDAAILVLVLIVLIQILAVSFTRPIHRLVGQASLYAGGEFGSPMPERYGAREIRELAKAFNSMGRDIVRQMEEVRVATERQERMHQELVIAAEFQQSILPRRFPPFPDLAEQMDVFGLMRAAKEVGGDFFDFVRLPNGRVGLMVGDVSDKGAPAALFMTQTRLLVRLLAEQGLAPSEILRRANRVLAQETPQRLFVTLLYVEFDPHTGDFELVSAGHPSPILIQPGQAPVAFSHPRALPLGAMARTRYQPVRGHMEPRARMLLYSDGLNEAMNPEREEFGMDRLLAATAAWGEGSCAELTENLCRDVAAFTREAPTSDDLTVLLLQRFGEGADHQPSAPSRFKLRLELPARTDQLEMVAMHVAQASRLAGLTERQAQELSQAVDEAVTNVIQHAYASDESCHFQLNLEEVSDGLRIIILDTGTPFDFASLMARTAEPLSGDQTVGGLGLRLMAHFADACNYEPGTLEGNRQVLIKRRQK